MKLRWLIIVGLLMETAYLSFYAVGESPNEVLLFICVNAFSFILITFVWLKVRTSKPEPRTFAMIFGFAVLFRLTLVPHAPVGSDDIYRYVWDGKVAARGINPFRYTPTDTALATLRTDELPSKINFPEMRTIYPLLAQGLFYFSNVLFEGSISGLKLLLTLADLITVLLLYRLFDAQLHNLLLYAWSPLPVMYFGLDGHIDALGIPFLLLTIYLIMRNRNVAGAFTLGLAGLTKLFPLFIAPFLFRVEKGWKRVFIPAIPVVMLALSGWLYWEPTGGLIESLRVFTATFEFNGSVFHLVYALVSSNEKAHLVSMILFAVWMTRVFFIEREIIEKVFLAFLGFIVFAPVVQPWYLSWLAVLLVLRWSPAVFALLALSNISNFIVYEYRVSGGWRDSMLLLLFEYVPFYVLLFWEIGRERFRLTTVRNGTGT